MSKEKKHKKLTTVAGRLYSSWENGSFR